MKYETPELTALAAINAIQTSTPSTKTNPASTDSPNPSHNELSAAYADWE
jgi:hypothetical protein